MTTKATEPLFDHVTITASSSVEFDMSAFSSGVLAIVCDAASAATASFDLEEVEPLSGAAVYAPLGSSGNVNPGSSSRYALASMPGIRYRLTAYPQGTSTTITASLVKGTI